MPNAWILHVKEFADKKKMKYNDALKSQECKDAYKSSKPKKETNDVTVKMPKMKKSDKLTMDTPMAVMPPPTEIMMPPMKMKRVRSKKGMME